MTIGPWKPIRFETYTIRITDIDIRPRVNEQLAAAVDVSFELSKSEYTIAAVTVKDPEGKVVIGQSNLTIKSERAEAHFKLSAGILELWYPVGYGKQPIYSVEIVITDKVASLHVYLLDLVLVIVTTFGSGIGRAFVRP